MTPHVDELIASPERHFDTPADVLREPSLTLDDKRRILESWKLDAQRLADSDSENMTGGEEDHLREVAKALVELKETQKLSDAIQVAGRGESAARGASLLTGLALGALLGAGAGLVIAAATGSTVAVVAQTAVAGLIVGGVAAAVRSAARR
jgi:hypothetical protein